MEKSYIMHGTFTCFLHLFFLPFHSTEDGVDDGINEWVGGGGGHVIT
jgi:hypothetical protein